MNAKNILMLQLCLRQLEIKSRLGKFYESFPDLLSSSITILISFNSFWSEIRDPPAWGVFLTEHRITPCSLNRNKLHQHSQMHFGNRLHRASQVFARPFTPQILMALALLLFPFQDRIRKRSRMEASRKHGPAKTSKFLWNRIA